MFWGNLNFRMGVHIIVQGRRATLLDAKAYDVRQKLSSLTLWGILIAVPYSGVIIIPYTLLYLFYSVEVSWLQFLSFFDTFPGSGGSTIDELNWWPVMS